MARTKYPFSSTKKLESYSIWFAIAVIAISGILYNIDPVKYYIKDWFFRKGVSDLEVFISYNSVLIGLLLIIIYRIGNRSEKLLLKLDHVTEHVDDKLFTKGTHAIYTDVDKELQNRIESNKKIIIDILGYTLFSVVPKLQEWKENKTLKKMHLNLYHLDSDFIEKSPDLDKTWSKSLRLHLDEIEKFKKTNSTYLRSNGVMINLYPYSHTPTIHGFRLSNGSLYLSLAYWDGDYLIGKPDVLSVYIKVSSDEKSLFAKEVRKVFSNWVNKAKSYTKNKSSKDEDDE